MAEILNQLSGFVVGSVPTMIFFVVLVAAYNVLVRNPLQKVLNERFARTSGAMDQAKAAIGAAEGKAAEYESRLREARASIFASRQERLKQWNSEREKAVAEARQTAQHRITAARESVERSGEEARQQLAASATQLSGKILQAILPKGNTQAVQG